MRIGILGTGTLAAALGQGWARHGHELVIGGRSRTKADALAARLGGAARAGTPREAVTGRDAVLLAVSWAGIEDVLRAAGAGEGTLAGTPLIDPTNAVEHGVGLLLPEPGSSAASRIAAAAPGAQVVKAFHLFAADQWTRSPSSDPGATTPTVVICGDDASALSVVSDLIRDVGGRAAALGGLDRARQLEETAGFVIGLAFAGFDPASAVPHVPTGAVSA
ncbi:NAD(P)-binding domain-containing protein [Frankia sp. AgPm24]|uniref:NADPH-dependent F420 reductase n=1 Tax=Frankia sp. AgPm24 TaxID=631128 RepID=UPI00200F9CC8|nr:NAD(P)-binding domain-containing protein [Frankia sp. AgPm24]MCK9921811.1 NAD(P)-binding domain-containing protein [Frankia sp. AgPm24]